MVEAFDTQREAAQWIAEQRRRYAGSTAKLYSRISFDRADLQYIAAIRIAHNTTQHRGIYQDIQTGQALDNHSFRRLANS